MRSVGGLRRSCRLLVVVVASGPITGGWCRASCTGVRAGVPRRDLPKRFGPWKTDEQHRRWSADGTWRQILNELRIGANLAEGEDWTVGSNSTAVRAH
jgi:transposase